MLSHDFEDITNVIEGRLSIVDEIGAVGMELRNYLALQFAEIIASPEFENVLPGLVAYDDLHTQRVVAVSKSFAAIAKLIMP